MWPLPTRLVSRAVAHLSWEVAADDLQVRGWGRVTDDKAA